MGATALLSILRSDSTPVSKPEPQIAVRTTEPQPKAKHTSSGVNLVRIVSQHGQGELDALDAEIERLQAKVAVLKRERMVVQQLFEIAARYIEMK